MNASRFLLLLLLLWLLPAAIRAADAPKVFSDFLAAEWEYRLEQSPTFASDLGDRRFNDRWEDMSLASIEAQFQHSQKALETLRTAIDRAALPPAEQLNYDLCLHRLQNDVDGRRFRWYLVPLNQREGIQTADDLADSLRFETVKDYEDWLGRLQRVPVLVEQITALMREGIRAKVLQPKIVMRRVPAQIAKQVVAKPEDSPFFKPFKTFPAAFSEADKTRLASEAKKWIAGSVVPAYRDFGKFFDSEYLPACFDQVGVWQIPDGDAAYAFFAREHTTTNLTPQQIHQIGLDEVARIHGEMEKIRQQVNFQGNLPEFFHYLRTDPQFFFKTPEELFLAYEAQAKATDPRLVKLFKTLPRMPYGVQAIPMSFAPDTTTAYYRQPAADGSRAGTFFVNLYRPETRPKWEMTALALHESVPGHHLQIALAQEQTGLPNFRRYDDSYTAYVEGWALYSEFLGEELGMYDDPYKKFGELTYEMWRAVRLVVDTGIHAYHWDRQKGIDYFMSNAPKTELDVTNEVDRYIAWPGQALAYKIGQLKIKELRARATQALGDKFDVKEFHDCILSGGALPLDVLEQRVAAWIAARQKG